MTSTTGVPDPLKAFSGFNLKSWELANLRISDTAVSPLIWGGGVGWSCQTNRMKITSVYTL